MLFLMIQKEIKQFLRSKSNLVMLFLFPIMLITVLGFSLESMMSGEFKIFDKKIITYELKDDGTNAKVFDGFKDEFSKEVGLKFKDGKLEQSKINEDKVLGHIEVSKDGFKYYRDEEGEDIASRIFKSVLDQVTGEIALYNTAAEINPAKIAEISKAKTMEYVSTKGLSTNNNISSFEYYTFAEAALIIIYIAVTIGEMVYKEQSFRTIERIRIAGVSESKIILSKVVLGLLIGIIQIALIVVYTSLALDVDWGGELLKMVLVLFALVIFATVVGVVVGLSVKSVNGVSGVTQPFITIVAIFGGAYCPLLMLTSIPGMDVLVKTSPIYWSTTGLMELNAGLEGNKWLMSVGVSIGLTLLMIAIYYIVRIVKRRNANA